MKTFYEIKNIAGGVEDVSTTTRKVKVVISQTGEKDFDNEVVDSAAYNKTLAERGPKSANLIWHLTDHNPSLKTAVGKFSELYMDGNKLTGITEIPNTSWGNDMMEFYLKGHINQHSIGFKTVKDEVVNGGKSDEYRVLKEVVLYEGSAVLWGANPNTPTVEAGKSLNKEEAKKQFDELADEWGLLMKSLKNGNMMDSTYEMIEMRISQNQEKQKELFKIFSTEPVITTQPEPPGGEPSVDTPPTIECPNCKQRTKNDGSRGYIRCHKCNAAFIRGTQIFIVNN